MINHEYRVRIARDLSRNIHADIVTNPNWFPTAEQIDHRVEKYCDNPDITEEDMKSIAGVLKAAWLP